MRQFTLLVALVFLLSGCISIEGINEKFRTVDQAWSIENQSNEAEQRYYQANADFGTTYAALRNSFVDLDMPIDKESSVEGFVVSRNEAPHPLSLAQWEEVREIENPKMRELVGSLMSLPKKSVGYFVTIRASIEPAGNQSTVSLDYYLEMPKYEDMGIIPSREAPPHAVTLMSEMFWRQFEYNLAAAD